MISEKNIQKLVIKHLNENGWTTVQLNNLDDLKKNFRKILDNRNSKMLKEIGLTSFSDKEFERYMSLIEHNNSFSDYTRFFSDDKNQIKSDTGKSMYIDIFDSQNICNNIFQVAEEVSNNGIRHDLLLLINGLPIANIELKNNAVSINNAFEQTKIYSSKLLSLFKFIQLFVISNENETRYYANNEDINRKYVFKYSDAKNYPIDNIFKFIENFFETSIFGRYISKYMINKTEEKKLIALRPYQVHGAEAAIRHLKTSSKNGFLWHATGSGKTITSFKVAQIAAKELKQFHKVIFLVDRKDLDAQTIKEYNSFLEKRNKIEETKNSRKLLEQLLNSKEKLIITTIQKMNRLMVAEDENIKQQINFIKDKGIVFIIDECHRSQFGDMNAAIRDKFTNLRYIGFTGTPIFADSAEEEQKDLVTQDIFHVNLHKYLMQNAIEDGNILGFHAQFQNDDMNIEKKNISKQLKDEGYLEKIADDIITYFDRRSINKKFSSIVVLENINTLIKFYRIMKAKQKDNKSKISVAGTFSFSGGYEEHAYERTQALKEMINDFNIITNSNETVDDIGNYQNRLQFILKEENNMPRINIVLVVDQLLTGFDAKRINTIYLARNIKKHSLIQAVSRTNRIFREDKERGQIISYVPGMQKNLDDSVKMYSDSNNVDLIIKRDYEKLVDEASKAYEATTDVNIQELMKNPSKNIVEAKKYIKRVKQLSDYYKVIRTIDKYDDKLIGEDFDLEKLNRMIKYAHVIKEEAKKVKEWGDDSFSDNASPFDAIDTPLYVDAVVTIDSEYIRILLGIAITDMENGDIDATKRQIQDIRLKLENTPGAELLLDVFDELLEKFDGDNKIDVKKALREIFNFKADTFIKTYKVKEEELTKQLYNFKIKERYSQEIILMWIDNANDTQILDYLQKRELRKEKSEEIKKHLDLFRNREEILGD